MANPVNRDSPPAVDGRWRPAWPWRARCLGCGEAHQGRIDLCAGCRARLPWLGPATAPCEPPLHRLVAAFAYAPPLDRWLPRFKFHRDLAAGRLLSQLMLEPLASVERPQALLPIPLHHARLRQRGYDQALELARPIARALALPLRGDLLRRVRATAPQSELDGRARASNLQDAFAVSPATAVPAHVALLDDVMTTGATLNAAAQALRRAGAVRIDAWVCARVT